MRRYPTGTTPHTHDKVYGFGHKKAPPRSLTLSPPYTENLIGTQHLHDEQHGNLRRAYGMSFNLCNNSNNNPPTLQERTHMARKRPNKDRLLSRYITHDTQGNELPRPLQAARTDYIKFLKQNSRANHVAYIDETCLKPTPAQHGFYSISAFVVDSNYLPPVRENMIGTLRDMVDFSGGINNDDPRVYYHFTEAHAGKDPNRPWLTDLNNGELLATIGNFSAGQHYLFTDYYIPYNSNDVQLEQNMEEARGRALAPTLLFLNQKYPGIAVVFESRNTNKDQTKDDPDKEGIERLKQTGLLPKNFSYTHTSPSIDPALIAPDGTGWANRRMQINGEAERLTQAGIKQITLDAYSLHPIQFGPQHPHNPEPYKEPKIPILRPLDHVYIARGAHNKGTHISDASKSMMPSNEFRSPALNIKDNPRDHDYFLQGYNQSRAAQGNYDVAFAQSVFNKKLTKPQQRSYLHVEKTIATTPALIAQLPDSVRELAQKTQHQMKLLYGKTTNEKETPKTSSPKVTGQAQQNAAQNEKTSEKPAQSLDPENAQLLNINQRTINASLRNLPKTQQQPPSPRRPEPPTPGLEL